MAVPTIAQLTLTPGPSPRRRLFVSYSHEDLRDYGNAFLRYLKQMLKGRPELGYIEDDIYFDRDQLKAGEDWHHSIQGALEQAGALIFLVSDYSLASRYCLEREVRQAVERSIPFIPVVLCECQWKNYPLPGDLQQRRMGAFGALPKDDQRFGLVPVKNWNDKNAAWSRVVEQIADALISKETSLETTLPAKSFAPAPQPSTLCPQSSDKQPEADAPIPGKTPQPPANTPPTILSRAKDASFTNSLGMKFVPVPRTRVWFSIWPTRVQDYEAFARDHPGLDGSWKDPVYEQVPVTPGPTHPVVCVSWEDAIRFCEWLTQKDQREGRLDRQQFYRLPTDLEWSAAVGLASEMGDTPEARNEKIPGAYPWGPEWPPPLGSGNFADQTAKFLFPKLTTIDDYRDGFATTAPVGIFNPSSDGVYDLSGNVWQWCGDWYNGENRFRVVRGVAWEVGHKRFMLSSFRLPFDPDHRDNRLGFRVVLVGGESARKAAK